MLFRNQLIRTFSFFLLLLPASPATAAGAGLDPAFELKMDESPVDRDDPAYHTSYAPILREAKEAVVAVHTIRVIRTYRSRGMDPREEILRRYFGLPVPRDGEPQIEERRDPVGVGSGVVISSDGYILTNNHVISAPGGPGGRSADDVLVRLNDGRELTAEVVGRDRQSDLAVLKVEAEDLPFLSFADSRNLEVGDVVFAVGNPMGVGLTITQGIVSATGRSNLSILGESGYENFIQTDAPINPGNSGGALIDAYGRLIGINTAILSRSGGSNGIGFAIPSRFARHVATEIVREGEVRRGSLGVNIESLNPDYVEAFELSGRDGALIHSVTPGLPAERAGLRNGDVITAIDGEPVKDAVDLRLKVASYPPGTEVRISYRRDGEEANVRVELADAGDPRGFGAREGVLLPGVRAAVIDDRMRREAGLPAGLEGLLVREVDPASPYAGYLRPGTVILQVNGVVPKGVDQAVQLMKERPVSRLYIQDRGRRAYLAIRPPEGR